MSHPTVEELTGFLYDELEPAQQDEIRDHLTVCDECKARVSAWQGVQRELATWELPQGTSRVELPHRPGLLRPMLKWAVAATVLMGGGFGLARMRQPKPADLSTLRAELTREIRDEVSRDLADQHAQFVSDQRSRNTKFEQAVIRALGELEARQVVATASLRKDVETLAIRAQQSFDQLAVADSANGRNPTRQP